MNKLNDILQPELMILSMEQTTKSEIIIAMATKLFEANIISDLAGFIEVIWEREAIGTTGIGGGIAIPHGRSRLVNKTAIVFARNKMGANFDSIDGKKTTLFFMIATPVEASAKHLEILGMLSGKLMHQEISAALIDAQTPEAVIKLLEQTNLEQQPLKRPLILAITGCSTGIAHTFMAAEKLKETARDLGIAIKVETNGATGVENALTPEQISKAEGIIIASDIKVSMDRFKGKKVILAPVADGIHKAQKLLLDIQRDNIEIYEGDAENSEQNSSSGGAIYKHLLSGVSHMLPFVVGGGIAIALAFLVDQILGVPQGELANLGSYNQEAAYLMKIGGMAFGFMLPVLAGYISYSIADRPGLVVGFVAGGIASSGGAGFLGALLGGFIAGYTIHLLKKGLRKLPKSLDGIKTILFYPVLGVLVVGGLMLAINIPMSQLNMALNNFLASLSGTNAIVLGMLLGTMMAADLGGPINKSAYIFATGTLVGTVATGGSSIMAAVMAAGMVPPLGVFFATTMFKNKFTKPQQQSGLTNLILGASFITEGAIPFAAEDPTRMIPSFIVGSSLTAALVLVLDIKVMAPHGGVFVIFLVSNMLLYLAVIIVGSLITAMMIGLLKKDIK
ncbi:MAG: PTS fructose transporter subunit IIABC [Culicoidibacterales bacterium]